MKKVRTVKKNSGTMHVHYPDEQSLGESHDMLVEALQGQSYVKETLHKVSTTEVTGEALKKVSAGGKGGMASGGDARDQEKQVEATSRVMVMSTPSQETFDHNVLPKQKAIRFGDVYDGIVEYAYESKHIGQVWCPSHLFGSKEVKGWVDMYVSIGRGYNDFAHSNSLDASDAQRFIEKMYAEWDGNVEFVKSLGLPADYKCPISKETLDRTRDLYDELCGYKGAWKYLGLNGAEHRRYRIVIINTLNTQDSIKYRYWKNEDGSVGRGVIIEDREPILKWLDDNGIIRKDIKSWPSEFSVARHHNDLHKIMNLVNKINDEDEANGVLREWMLKHTSDHGYYVMWYLDQKKPKQWSVTNQSYNKVEAPKANKYIKARRVKMAPEYEAKRERIKELTSELYKDVKVVYNWEGTRAGKMKFVESNRAVQPEGWTCKDRERKNRIKRYTK